MPDSMHGSPFAARRTGAVLLSALFAAAVAALALAPQALASKTQWSIFEDHPYLVQTTPAVREQTLNEIQQLGADTIRIELKWNEVAPAAYSKKRPSFDASDPSQYPGFGRYDDLVKSVQSRGMRILMTITGDAPVWATSGGRGGNYKPSAKEFAKFATAVGTRYSGRFGGLPKVSYFTLWNEPNHIQFLKPTSQAPRVYRALVDAGLPALKSATAPGTKIFIGELKPTPRKGLGPIKFLQEWLCLDKDFKRLRGRAARKQHCPSHFKKIKANGFAHHPYGPVGSVSKRVDIINLSAIKRLAKDLDLAAKAGRIPRGLPIYDTEFGIQTNPPDIFVSTSPSRQARIINEKEMFAYNYPRLKSHSQYQLYDDPARSGPPAIRWSGFQTGLRFANGTEKPAWDAYRFPIVVKRQTRSRVLVWGRVRPRLSGRLVQVQRRSGHSYVNVGARIATNSLGYFTVKAKPADYRFEAYGHDGTTSTSQVSLLGKSRTASPVK
jgi:Cellulase (glycosyl hydrolase family 5)